MSELIDNRAQRIRTMKALVRQLHEGADAGEVRQALMALVRSADAGEVAAMEQELLSEGVPVEELMQMCDLHSHVLRDVVVIRPHAPVVRGHPVDVFERENAALRTRSVALRETLAALVSERAPDARVSAEDLAPARALVGELRQVDAHYARKENLLFPVLERHGITGPSTVMWGKDDEVRELLGALGDALEAPGSVAEWELVLETVAWPALEALEEMVRKEEAILLPLSLQTLNENEWGEVWRQSPELGFVFVDPAGGYAPPAPQRRVDAAAAMEAERRGVALSTPRAAKEAALVFPSGTLDLDQLKAIFGVLPVDLTFVDADDRVRFFSEGPDRVFPRPRTILGRKVEHCHPPASVHVVQQILADFRSGRQDTAEFWIALGPRFVHIRYFAVRDAAGAYLGTLEVTQDLAAARALEGERRLLEYD